MSEDEKKPAEEASGSVAECAPAPEPDDTISKVHTLQKRFYAVCGELFKYIEFIGEPMYNLMLEHYFAQYKREYELMNAKEFIEVDKQIESLKAERDRELEAVKLERDKQKRLLDIARESAIKAIELDKAKLTEKLAMLREKELEEVNLEHEAQKAEIERRREKLDNDIDVLWNTAVLENQIKLSRVIPQSWRKFHIGKWHFGRVCRNEAMTYAEQAANNEIMEYLTNRARALSEESEEEIAEPAPMTGREYSEWQKRFEKEQRKRKNEAEKQSGPEHTDEQEIAPTEGTETQVQGEEPETAPSVSLIAENIEGD